MMDKRKSSIFTRFSGITSRLAGHPVAFIVSVLTVVVWAAVGPLFRYSDTWQLVINTGTTVITFLMVFVIQNSQNRDSAALHLKLDELITSIEKAHNEVMDAEDRDEDEIRQERERLLQEKDAETPTGKTRPEPE